jgi:transposase-like protein
MGHMRQKTRVTRVYDAAFKERVVGEYLEGKISYRDLMSKYNIASKGAIAEWTRRSRGITPPRGKKLSFARQPINMPMAGQEKTKIELEKENRELKRQLEDANLRAEAYFRIIEKAEQELKINLKKKLNSK